MTRIARLTAALVVLLGGTVGVAAQTPTTYTSEAEFLAAVSGAMTLEEGFEDDGTWGAARSPETEPSVTSQGVTWTSNHAANAVSTSGGAASTGSWGVYSDPHGDQSVPNPTDRIYDGVVGSSTTAMRGVGGWFRGTFGSQLVLILDGDEGNPIDLGAVDSSHRFYGAVADGSFTSFEFREIEGTREDQKLIYADDFTIALASGANAAPNGTIVQPAGNPSIETGQTVLFEGAASDPDGDAVTVLWDLGDGTTSTALSPGAHTYSTPGTFNVTLTATDEHGLSDPTPATRTVTVTAVPPPATDGVVAGVADIRGAQGSDWHTDLALHNAGTAAIDVELYFSPAGGSIGAPVSVTVAASATETLADVVSAAFGASGSGAILWRVTSGDPDALLVSANTYNRLGAVKRYGQQVPGIPWSEAAPAGTALYLPALAGPFRSNLGFAVDGDCTEVLVRGYDRLGVLKVERTIPVEPLSWTQLNKLLRSEFPGLITNPNTVAVEDSLHRFEVVGVDGRIVAYTSILDNSTNDGSYLLARRLETASGRTWLTGAAFVRGLNDSQWRSDVLALNLSGAAGSMTLSYLPAEQDNGGSPDSRTVDLGSGEAVLEGNILRQLFGVLPPAVGSLGAAADRWLLWMRTYTEEPGPQGFITYGQAIPALVQADMVAAGSEGRVFGFAFDDRTRSNLILQNTFVDGSGNLLPTAVRVDVLDRTGAVIHQQSYDLRAGEYLQHNGFLAAYGVGWITGAALRIVVTDAPAEAAGGGVAAMVSEVNGATLPGTNDGRLLKATVRPTAVPP